MTLSNNIIYTLNVPLLWGERGFEITGNSWFNFFCIVAPITIVFYIYKAERPEVYLDMIALKRYHNIILYGDLIKDSWELTK